MAALKKKQVSIITLKFINSLNISFNTDNYLYALIETNNRGISYEKKRGSQINKKTQRI